MKKFYFKCMYRTGLGFCVSKSKSSPVQRDSPLSGLVCVELLVDKEREAKPKWPRLEREGEKKNKDPAGKKNRFEKNVYRYS